MILDPNGPGFLGAGRRGPAPARLVLDAYQVNVGAGVDAAGQSGVRVLLDVAGWPVSIECFLPAAQWVKLVDSVEVGPSVR